MPKVCYRQKTTNIEKDGMPIFFHFHYIVRFQYRLPCLAVLFNSRDSQEQFALL